MFADYISNVLPELGEEKIRETGMEDLARRVLDKKYRFQTFFEQVAKVVEGREKNFIERISFKASHDLLNRLNKYVTYIENELFVPNDLKVGRYYVPFTFVAQKYMAFSRVPLFKRFGVIAQQVAEFIRKTHRNDLKAPDINKIEGDIRRMLKYSNLRDLYKHFYEWMGKSELYTNTRGGLEYSDVYPLIYLKQQLEGIKTDDGVKHLLIDEMQDYTPVQYAVVSRLFPCKKTILGDTNQSVNPYSSSTPEDIERVFVNAYQVRLMKSYRSTFEITNFAQSISRNDELVPVERHGETPSIHGFNDQEAEILKIRDIISSFSSSGFNSMGIVCKTQKQAGHIYEALKDNHHGVYFLNTESVAFVNGVVIATVHMSKGLEFDHVIVPFVNQSNYRSETDKKMLYIACTRAMHRLDVTHTGKISGFIKIRR